MKGIAHFASGLCIASFVPGALDPGSLLIALGGACALLPDLLDFRFERFIEKRDAEIAPDLFGFDPQRMADAVAREMRLVAADGAPRVAQFHPTRQTATDWLLYSLRFDNARGDVLIEFDNGRAGRAHAGEIEYTYDGALHIEELGGPSLKFARSGDGKVHAEFLPWHRARTHSLVLALIVGLVCGLLFGPTAGVVGFLGYAVHVLEDQLGYMGSNLWWPFTRSRTPGLGLLHAADAPANIATIWISLSVLLLNMDRASATPQLAVGPYFAFVVVLPSAMLIVAQARKVTARRARVRESERQGEIVSELEEVE